MDCYLILKKRRARMSKSGDEVDVAIILSAPQKWCYRFGEPAEVEKAIEDGEDVVDDFYSAVVDEVENAKGDEVDNVLTLGNFIRLYTMLDRLAMDFTIVAKADFRAIEVLAQINDIDVEHVSEGTVDERVRELEEAGWTVIDLS